MSGNGYGESVSQAPARAKNGQFLPGNNGGGYPFQQHVKDFRQQLYDCVTEEDYQEICRSLIRKARAGEPWAVRELLDRLLGKSTQHVDLKHTLTIRDVIDQIQKAEVIEGGESDAE